MTSLRLKPLQAAGINLALYTYARCTRSRGDATPSLIFLLSFEEGRKLTVLLDLRRIISPV